MALSDDARIRLGRAMASDLLAKEVADLVDAPNAVNATFTNATITTATITTATTTNASLANTLTAANGAVVVANTAAGGFKIGTAANQRIGLWGATPIVQPAGTGELIGTLGSADTTANATNMNSNGNTGTARYSFNDVIKALKTAGILTS